MDTKARHRKGFTLMEMLIAVAIIAILVAVAIPVFTAQMHKVRVAADWANIRAYYSEIQADFILTGAYNSKVPDMHKDGIYDRTELDFLSGEKVTLKDGYYGVTTAPNGIGYEVSYYCNQCRTTAGYEKHKDTCILILG